MAEQRLRWSMRRMCAPTAVALFACLTVASTALAAAPAPDPPPLQVSPEPAPTSQPSPRVTAPVARQAPVSTPAPVVRHSTPAVVVPVRTVPKPKAAAPVQVTRVVKPKAPAPTPVARPPHDRNRVPLAAFVPAVDSIDRDLLALGGVGLLLVALAGAVVLLTVRRQLRELAL